MSGIRQMRYAPASGAATSVEILTFDRLREMNRGATQRADFSVLVLVRDGEGSLSIDFTTHRLTARSAVWIPPGSVHSWTDMADLEGELVLSTSTAPVSPGRNASTASMCEVDRANWTLVLVGLDHLRTEASDATQNAATDRVLRLLLSALLLRLGLFDGDSSAPITFFNRFQVLVENRFRARHDAGFYARELACAPRTLSRAVQAACGRTAKAYISDRLVLEAKRLLVHERLSIAQCAFDLGFLDPSSFSVFFKSHAGATPTAWRDANR